MENPSTLKPVSISDLKPLPGRKHSTISPAAAYLHSLPSPTSRLTMVSPLNRVARIILPSLEGKSAWKLIPWERLEAPHVRVILAELEGSPATRNKALAALKGVARAAWELKQMSTDTFERIRSIKGDAGSRELAGRFIPEGEIKSLLSICAKDSSPSGARDAAMISLAASTGARRAEIASLVAENLSIDEDGLFQMRVIGKRNKERMLYIRGNAARFFSDWLALRFEEGKRTGPLFCAIQKGGTILEKKSISPTAADKILRKRCLQAGLADLDWHDLRRTTTSNLLDAGADIATVAGILGHSNIQTTARYDRRGERAKIKAAELISIPYFSRN